MSNSKYAVTWDKDNLHKVIIHDAYDPRTFALRGTPFTDEEKAVYNAKKAAQTPQENLADLMFETFIMSWKASELAKWFEKFASGYKIGRGKDKDVRIEFADLNHAMLFKLTWV